MCKHCERIKEDIGDKPVVHAFMSAAARNLTRRTGILHTADDLDCDIHTVNPLVVSAVNAARNARLSSDELEARDSTSRRIIRTITGAFGPY
jgi:hypothetical protein